ncbi:quinone-dependent dihydroorotate dehydrogenase [Algicella marina]|uniref:Dihydroorotate dehydrogenase (quinone) n=1 Tax=Algicella marina TaxID=2683284 RepID=A0A6P1SWW2_9RHOB|nr:quinone-dependent dihydroorotate dehydrogenase [Algicella marina]QHQ34015.1 quinone-dependent dihydroorotate dehydrogenase [Algicella marina]
MKQWLEQIGLAALQKLEPEQAHTLALAALRRGLAPLPAPFDSPRLATDIAGLKLPNPLGLAAGFDKNAEVLGPLSRVGFGFIEVGAVTPRPQEGNPRPRLFRLTEDRGVINRFGFNNQGMRAAAAHLAAAGRPGITGINLGANKDSEDRAADFGAVLRCCGLFVDFATINVSSPNTEKLRDLQGRDALRAVLQKTQEANAGLTRPVPLFLKIAPDLEPQDLDDIVAECEAAGMAGIIATNTTLDRQGLSGAAQGEKGGLSGQPLFAKSTAVLSDLKARTDLPLIGVGGISSPEQAIAKLEAGATALQLYSGLVYKGLSLVPEILRGIDAWRARQP